MIPGPDVRKLSLPTAIGARIDIVRGREVLALDVPVMDVVLDGNSSRTVPLQLSFDAPIEYLPKTPLDPLNIFGQTVHLRSLLEIEGVPYEIGLGCFLIDSWKETNDGVSVKALDLMKTLEKDEMLWPSSPPKGATLWSEAQRLAGNIPVTLDCANRPLSNEMQWGRSRTKAITDLCAGLNLEFAVQPDGYLHLWERRNGRLPIAAYTSNDLLKSALRTSQERRPNRVSAVGEMTALSGKSKKTEKIKVTATVSATQSPYDVGYGIVRKIIDIKSVTGESATKMAAQRELSRIMMIAEKRQVEIDLDPRLELGDVIAVTPPKDFESDAATGFVGRIIAYSKPLDDPKAKMRIDVEVLAW